MRKAYGFTIVELLIVIVVIAILATISIVAYNGIQNRTYDSAIQSDLSTLGKKLELYKVDNSSYPNSDTALNSIDFKISKEAYDPLASNVYFVLSASDDNYALGVRSRSGQGFMLTKSGVQTVPYINGNATAQFIDLDAWGSADYRRQIYVVNSGVPQNGSGWTNGWWSSTTWVD